MKKREIQGCHCIFIEIYPRPIFFESLFSRMWMWSFQVRFSSTIIPKNFIDVVLLISKLFIFRIESFRGKLSLSQDLWKRVNFVLPSFKESFFAWNQIVTFSNSAFAVWKRVLICFPAHNTFVSSENAAWYYFHDSFSYSSMGKNFKP